MNVNFDTLNYFIDKFNKLMVGVESETGQQGENNFILKIKT